MSELAFGDGIFELSALDGANPLGFLAALGTLISARGAGEYDARVRFRRGSTWTPIIEGVSTVSRDAFSEMIVRGLAGQAVASDSERVRAQAQREFDAAKKACENKRKELKKRGLQGKERLSVLNKELSPLEGLREQKRSAWLAALAAAVPRSELALGKRIDCTPDEYRAHAENFSADADRARRESLDLLAAFGSDALRAERSEAIQSTPFCFITGSGHQFFLDTVRQLMDHVAPDRVRHALFEPWTYRDEGLSMRWDPMDDRRYALMDRDPTASNNKSRTVWMANLLAYRALVLFPCAARRFGLGVTGWSGSNQAWTFTWPIWEFAAPPDTVRSLLQLEELLAEHPDRRRLRARGVAEVFRAKRIKVGAGANYKLNFSQARAV